MDCVDRKCDKRLNELRCEYDLLVQKLREEHETEKIEILGGVSNINEIKKQRDEHAEKITELHQFIEDLKCRHCKELQSAHHEIYFLKDHLAEKCDLLEKTGVSVKELTEMRLMCESAKRSVVEKDTEMRHRIAEYISEIEALHIEYKAEIEDKTFTLSGEICLLRDMLIAKNKDYDNLTRRLEDLELAQSNHNINSEEISAVYKQ